MNGAPPVLVFGGGLVAGGLLFFLCYWWVGSLTLSVLVGLAAGALTALAARRASSRRV